MEITRSKGIGQTITTTTDYRKRNVVEKEPSMIRTIGNKFIVQPAKNIIQGTGQFLEAKEKKLNVNVQRTFVPAPMLSRQQAILKDMFGGGERQWGTGQNLPVINHDLDNPNGGGIIKSRDGGRTGGFFGMRR
jgi:hypothetical protein